MGVFVLLIYLALCAAVYFVFTKIFRNRFKDYDKHDEIVDTDGETYIVYKPEERRKSFIKEYAVYINDDSKFLKISLSPIVEYINVEIVCYRGNKIYKIISFLNEINRKQDQYMLKLPDSTEEVKLNVREVNGARYSDLDLLKRDVLWRSIVSSIILASISSLILFIFRLSTIQFINEYFDWNYVYQVLFYEPWIYLYLVLAIIVFGLILFAILYIPNCLKYRRAQFNRTKNLRIDKVLRFKVKHTSKGTFNNYTIKLKKKRKMHLLDAMCLVTCKDENDELIKEYKLHIKKRGTRFRISGVNKYTKLNVEVDVLTADFKKYYYNGEFRRKVTKKGVSCKFLTLRGFEKATTLFGVAVLAISAFSIYKYLDLRNVNVSLQNYEFVEEGNSYAVESFSGEVSKLVLPSSYNGKPVNKVNGLAFYNVSFNEPSYDDGDYEIGGSIVTPDVDGKAALAIDEVYFSKPSDGSGYYLDNSSFAGCINIKKVDLTNVSYVGPNSFSGARIREIIIDHPIRLDSQAFNMNNFLRKIEIKEGSGADLNGGVFSGSKVDRLDFYPLGNYFTTASFSGLTIEEGYVYKNDLITSSNVDTYFDSPNVLVEMDCVHDNRSFIFRGGQMVTTKSFDIVEMLIEPTCHDYGYAVVKCKYCGENYTTGLAKDMNNHDFGSDGNSPYCIYCNAPNPDYVPPKEENENEDSNEKKEFDL